jgi:signal transduction histidine kinase
VTGKGSIAHAPYRRLKWMLGVHVMWIGTVLVLGVWWGSLILEKATRIAELERTAGLSTSESWERTQRMIFWEGGAFVVLLLASTALLVYLYWREAQRAKALQAFFASVTHELRTPLTSIRLQAESIGDSVGKNPLVDRLLEDTQRLESQVERTLELARVEGGGRVFLEGVPLKAWTDRMLKSWSENHGERVSFEAEVPSELLVQADTSALQVILKNLFENSLRHARQDTLQIQLRAASEGGRVELKVRDNGRGADSDKLGKLFEKGAQSQGAGVGLYLVRVLMERMGGKARFEGHQGFETTLVFKEGRADG